MGDLVRILYVHVPVAAITYLTLLVSMLTGLLFLSRRSAKYDLVSESAALLGLVYGSVTLVTGSIWANATWGVYWNWDPRETTTLILWLAYVGYFFLRMSVENPDRRAYVAAAFNVLAFLTVPLSYVSFTLWPSIHPKLISDGALGLTMPMVEALILSVSAAFLLYIWLMRRTYTLRLGALQLETALEERRVAT
jgi:heme exporter protein C